MPGILKVLLWTGLAAVVAVAVVVGFGIFRLSQIFPDADEGRSIAEQIEEELVAHHPAFSVDTRAEPSFAEVGVRITPVDGELREPEVSELLATLQEVVAEHADSRWTIDSTVEGRWETSRVSIEGSDVDAWPELSPALELGDSSRAAVTILLDERGASVSRDLDTEHWCGADTTARDFFADAAEEASDDLTELGWTAPEDPVLAYHGSGCAGPLRISVDLSGQDRLGRVEDLQALVDSLPGDVEIAGITVRESGELEVAFEDDATGPLLESVVSAWSHGEVWVNGSRATGS